MSPEKARLEGETESTIEEGGLLEDDGDEVLDVRVVGEGGTVRDEAIACILRPESGIYITRRLVML
jgi:hypothetical protein